MADDLFTYHVHLYLAQAPIRKKENEEMIRVKSSNSPYQKDIPKRAFLSTLRAQLRGDARGTRRVRAAAGFEEGRELSSSSRRIRRWLILMPMTLLPLLLGGARPWLWSGVAAAFFVGLAIHIWTEQRIDLLAGVSRWWYPVLGALLAYPFFQAISLPAAWLDILSPQRLIWLQRANEISQQPLRTASLSYMPLVTAFSGLYWLFLVGYGLILRKALREERNLEWFFRSLVCLAALEAFYGLLQVLIPSLGVFGGGELANVDAGYARGTFINRNHFAAFLGMIWPLLLAYMLGLSEDPENAASSFERREREEQVRHKQLFIGLIVALILLALVFSASRGGMVSSLIALSVFIGFGRGGRRRGLLYFTVGCWGVMFAYGSMIGFDEILMRFDTIEESASGRLKVWSDTFQIIKDHPLVGTGLGSFDTISQVYQSHFSDNLRIAHAHNDYLELISELGVPVACSAITIIWGYWIRSVHHLRDEAARGGRHMQVNRRHLLSVGALAGIAAFLCHSWVEFNWQIPANQLLLVTLLVFAKSA